MTWPRERIRSSLCGGSPLGFSADVSRVGLALSGGGIRSATFNLGLLQAFAGRGWMKGGERDVDGDRFPDPPTPLQRVDYLSTVSGGGYIGGFLGQLYCRIGMGVAGVVETLKATTSPSIAFLRENGRYLSPNGSGDLWVAVATMLRSWFALQGILSLFFAIPFLAWILIRAAFVFRFETADPRWLQGLYLSPLVLAPIAVLTLCTLPAGIAYWFVPGPGDRALPLGPKRMLAILLATEAAIATLGYQAHVRNWSHFDSRVDLRRRGGCGSDRARGGLLAARGRLEGSGRAGSATSFVGVVDGGARDVRGPIRFRSGRRDWTDRLRVDS
ncbi:MAG: hypothetical protein QM784_18795 [Polyangiaceae bacterium]